MGAGIGPIPGTKRRRHLDENIRAAALYLSAAEVDEISDLVGRDRVAGARYPPAELARVGI